MEEAIIVQEELFLPPEDKTAKLAESSETTV
jgi:hypothetical protein